MILPYNWKENLRPGNLRDTINRNSAVVSIVAVVVIIVVVALSIRKFMGGGAASGVASTEYFWDTSNHTLHVRSAAHYPPLIGSTGKPTMVLAYYYTCTNCGDKKIVYLMKYSPQAKAALEKMKQGGPPGQQGGMGPMAYMAIMQQPDSMLVRSPAKGSPWVPENSQAGIQVTTPPACPGGGYPKECVPH